MAVHAVSLWYNHLQLAAAHTAVVGHLLGFEGGRCCFPGCGAFLRLVPFRLGGRGRVAGCGLASMRYLHGFMPMWSLRLMSAVPEVPLQSKTQE